MNDFDNSNDGVEGSQTFVKLSENNETGGGAADVPNSLDDGFWKEQVEYSGVYYLHKPIHYPFYHG